MKPSPDREEIEAEIVRAEKSLKAAKVLLADNLLEDALSRTYYAILHAARAVLLSEGIRVDSHKAVRRLFGQHLVNTGKLHARYATILAEEQDDRFLADYDVVFAPEKDRVEKRIRDAEGFLRTMEEFLEKQSDA